MLHQRRGTLLEFGQKAREIIPKFHSSPFDYTYSPCISRPYRLHGLGNFEINIYRLALKLGGKRDDFAITTGEQWKLELPSTLDGTGNEMNSLYF